MIQQISIFLSKWRKSLKQIFCSHNWVKQPCDLDNEPHDPDAVMTMEIRLHICSKCGREETFGGGWIC